MGLWGERTLGGDIPAHPGCPQQWWLYGGATSAFSLQFAAMQTWSDGKGWPHFGDRKLWDRTFSFHTDLKIWIHLFLPPPLIPIDWKSPGSAWRCTSGPQTFPDPGGKSMGSFQTVPHGQEGGQGRRKGGNQLWELQHQTRCFSGR